MKYTQGSHVLCVCVHPRADGMGCFCIRRSIQQSQCRDDLVSLIHHSPADPFAYHSHSLTMKFTLTTILPLLALAPSTLGQEWPCGNCTNESPEPIEPVPAPWILKADAYAFPIPPVLGPLPSKAYAPLEKGSTATQGTYLGVAGAVLIVRYTDTPVGPYDELTFIPGAFGYNKKYENGLTLPAVGIRGTRFYVSQKYTNWNGRVSKSQTPNPLLDYDSVRKISDVTGMQTGISPSTSPNSTGPPTSTAANPSKSTPSTPKTNPTKATPPPSPSSK